MYGRASVPGALDALWLLIAKKGRTRRPAHTWMLAVLAGLPRITESRREIYHSNFVSHLRAALFGKDNYGEGA